MRVIEPQIPWAHKWPHSLYRKVSHASVEGDFLNNCQLRSICNDQSPDPVASRKLYKPLLKKVQAWGWQHEDESGPNITISGRQEREKQALMEEAKQIYSGSTLFYVNGTFQRRHYNLFISLGYKLTLSKTQQFEEAPAKCCLLIKRHVVSKKGLEIWDNWDSTQNAWTTQHPPLVHGWWTRSPRLGNILDHS